MALTHEEEQKLVQGMATLMERTRDLPGVCVTVGQHDEAIETIKRQQSSIFRTLDEITKSIGAIPWKILSIAGSIGGIVAVIVGAAIQAFATWCKKP